MRNYFSGLFFATLGSAALMSCTKELNEQVQDPVVETNCWEKSHTAFFNLSGKVREVNETIYQDEELLAGYQYKFDSNQCLVSYDPTYYPLDTRSFDFDWGSSAELFSAYEYNYDAQGLLAEVVRTAYGEETGRYKFTYGNHGKYVPMQIPFGGKKFFLLKNLVSISTEEGELLTYADDKAVFTERSFLSTRTVTYDFTGSYPTSSSDISERGGEELSRTESKYMYDEKGALVREEIKLTESGEQPVSTIINYSDEYMLSPLSKQKVYPLISRSWDYTYTMKGWPDKVTLSGYKAEETDPETNTYFSEDHGGNWTERVRVSNAAIDENLHAEGKQTYKRVIFYY